MKADKPPKTRDAYMPVVYCLRIRPELKEEVGKKADAQKLPMNELIGRVLAAYVDRPDLADFPRKIGGKRRSKMPEATEPEPVPA